MTWFREPSIVHFAPEDNGMKKVMVVAEEPTHSIYRHDFIIPPYVSVADQFRMYAAVFEGLARDADRGITRFKEGETSPFCDKIHHDLPRP